MFIIEKCTELFMMDLILLWAKRTILISYGVFVRRQGLFLCKYILPLLQTTSEIVMIKQHKYYHKLSETSQQQTSTDYWKLAAGPLKRWLGVCLMERGLRFSSVDVQMRPCQVYGMTFAFREELKSKL